MHTEFQAPIDDRYFEDYIDGHVHEFGSISVSEAEIIEFGRRYDPQPFHTSTEAARHTQFGGDVGERDEHPQDESSWPRMTRRG